MAPPSTDRTRMPTRQFMISNDATQSVLNDLLVCPRDKEDLTQKGQELLCPQGHRYAVLEGVPVLLVSDSEQTHIEGARALAAAETGDLSSYANFQVLPGQIDPFVRNAIGATNGSLYQHLVGTLSEYPIPSLRLPAGGGRLFLEIGCNWGRWCFAAARLGYRPIGIDPSLRSIRAARRVCQQLGIAADFVVADGRFLPFRDRSFAQVFSYSVLQHLSMEDAMSCMSEIHRVLDSGGRSLVQMANVFGIRCLYHQIRRGFREARDFEVRYWTPSQLNASFTERIGPSELTVDGYFSLNVQPSDIHLLLARHRPLVYASEGLRWISNRISFLAKLADSLYVDSLRAD